MSLLAKFERYPLTFGTTPIEHLPRLSAALGGKVQVYAKRDDCNSGLAMGGNNSKSSTGANLRRVSAHSCAVARSGLRSAFG